MTTKTEPKREKERRKLIRLLKDCGLGPSKTQTLRKLLDLADSADSPYEANRIVEAFAECLCRGQQTVEPRPVSDVLSGYDTEGLARHRSHVAQNIIKYRTEKGWTQQDLANAAGLLQSHISRIENCKLAPTQLTIAKLSKALAVRKVDLDLGFRD